MQPLRTIAYFSMEVGLEAGMPTYSGGLGILAGDTIRAAADLTVPMVAVTLLYRSVLDGWWIKGRVRKPPRAVPKSISRNCKP